MQDMHVHIERGPYTKEWLDKFIDYAKERGIQEIGILEHSHRFMEFRGIYDSIVGVTDYGKYQEEWINRRSEVTLQSYKDFIKKMQKEEFPIKVNFGLEVCYFPYKDNEIKSILSDFNWDFVTGSIHWIDGWGFDHPKTKDSWEGRDVNNIYTTYYKSMIQLIDSGLFSIVAHPDSIKCFNYYPTIDMGEYYEKVAKALNKMDMKAEINTGLHYRYGHDELGINKTFLGILRKHGVRIVTVSDAHRPEDVGMLIREATDIVGS